MSLGKIVGIAAICLSTLLPNSKLNAQEPYRELPRSTRKTIERLEKDPKVVRTANYITYRYNDLSQTDYYLRFGLYDEDDTLIGDVVFNSEVDTPYVEISIDCKLRGFYNLNKKFVFKDSFQGDVNSRGPLDEYVEEELTDINSYAIEGHSVVTAIPEFFKNNLGDFLYLPFFKKYFDVNLKDAQKNPETTVTLFKLSMDGEDVWVDEGYLLSHNIVNEKIGNLSIVKAGFVDLDRPFSAVLMGFPEKLYLK